MQVIGRHLIFTIQRRNAQLNVAVLDVRLTVLEAMHLQKLSAQRTERTIAANNQTCRFAAGLLRFAAGNYSFVFRIDEL